jgi:hypothetical protein
MDQSVQEARAKLAARYSNGTQIGGKGKPLTPPTIDQLLTDLFCRHPKKNQEGSNFPECWRRQEAQGHRQKVRYVSIFFNSL